jgi:radical SAM superfamily enzyme
MGHKAQTAGIVFVALGVQTVVLEMLDLGSRRHGESSYINRRERKITTGMKLCNKI